MLKRILGNFYYRLFSFMGILLLTALFPMPVVDSTASTRIWIPGYYCVLVPDKANQGLRYPFPCTTVRASEFAKFDKNAAFIPVDSILVFFPGTAYTLPANVDAEVYALESQLKIAFQMSLILMLVGLTFAEMIRKNLE